MIAGLLRPDAGRVRIDGIDVASARVAALERIGVLHDEFGLYPRLTAREHLRFAAELHGLRGSARDAAVARAVERLEIGSLADRRAKGFSHGQRMKVALWLMGHISSPVFRRPTRPLTTAQVDRIRADLHRIGCATVN